MEIQTNANSPNRQNVLELDGNNTWRRVYFQFEFEAEVPRLQLEKTCLMSGRGLPNVVFAFSFTNVRSVSDRWNTVEADASGVLSSVGWRTGVGGDLGRINFTRIVPLNPNEPVTVTFYEDARNHVVSSHDWDGALIGFYPMQGSVTLILEPDGMEWTLSTEIDNTIQEEEISEDDIELCTDTNIVTINVANIPRIPPFNFQLTKVERLSSGTELRRAGAVFDVHFHGIEGRTTERVNVGLMGAMFSDLVATNGESASITVTEVEAPRGLRILANPITTNFQFSLEEGWRAIPASNMITHHRDRIELRVPNERYGTPPPPVRPPTATGESLDLIINKRETMSPNGPLEGARFEILIQGPSANHTLVRETNRYGQIIIPSSYMPSPVRTSQGHDLRYADPADIWIDRAPIRQNAPCGETWCMDCCRPGEWGNQTIPAPNGSWVWLAAPPPTWRYTITIRELEPNGNMLNYKQMIGDIRITLQPSLVTNSTTVHNVFHCSPGTHNGNPAEHPCASRWDACCVQHIRCSANHYCNELYNNCQHWHDSDCDEYGCWHSCDSSCFIPCPGGHPCGNTVYSGPGHPGGWACTSVGTLLGWNSICRGAASGEVRTGGCCRQARYVITQTTTEYEWVFEDVTKDSTICDDEFIARSMAPCVTPDRVGVFVGQCSTTPGPPCMNCPRNGGNICMGCGERQITVNIHNIPLLDVEALAWLKGANRDITGKVDGIGFSPSINDGDLINGIDVFLTYGEGVRNHPRHGISGTCACPPCQRRRRDLRDNGSIIGGNAYYNLTRGRPHGGQDFYRGTTSGDGTHRWNMLRADLTYSVEYRYDGINYIVGDTRHVTPQDCTANEERGRDSRQDFNNNFRTITPGMGLVYIDPESVGLLTGLEYRGLREKNSTLVTSRLQTMVAGLPRGGNGSTIQMSRVIDRFAMYARTTDGGDFNGRYRAGDTITFRAGLQTRETALTLRMEPSYALVTINGQRQEYQFNLDNGQWTLTGPAGGNSNSFESSVDARLGVYSADVNFRISDYLVAYNVNEHNDEFRISEADMNNILNGNAYVQDHPIYQNAEEIRIEITYRVTMNSRAGNMFGGISPRQVAIYFDNHYEFVRVEGASASRETGRMVNIAEGENLAHRELIVDLTGGYLGDGGRTSFDVTFCVRSRDTSTRISSGDRHGQHRANSGQPIEIDRVFHSFAEVTIYRTQEGLVDRASAVGTAVRRDGADGSALVVGATEPTGSWRPEANVDHARGMLIEVHNPDEIRTLSGVVWHDGRVMTDSINSFGHGDGILDWDEELVCGVIVQLIEVKEIGGTVIPQFWKETVTGSDWQFSFVRNSETNGRDTDPTRRRESNGGTRNGEFRFEGIVAGRQYILRFIYGDGRIITLNPFELDPDQLDSIREFNGQDFQSTIRNVSTHNTAIDNEWRRLQVMAHSIEIDRTKGVELERREAGDLRNTWMSADTVIIPIPIEPIYDYTNHRTYVVRHDGGAGSQNIVNPDQRPRALYDIRSMDFGLVSRPETRLFLLKYLDELTIQTSARDALLNAMNSQISGQTTPNLLQLSPTREDTLTNLIAERRETRGFWAYETDVDELLAGSAFLQALYRYYIVNMSQPDFLGSELVARFNAVSGIGREDAYAEFLRDRGDDIFSSHFINPNGNIRRVDAREIYEYLGDAYRTGRVGPDDRLVTTIVTGIEEAINNLMTFADENNQFEARAGSVILPGGRALIYGTGEESDERIEIDTVIRLNEDTRTRPLSADNVDRDNAALLTRLVSASDRVGDDLVYVSHIAEVTSFSNAAGRRAFNIPNTRQLNQATTPMIPGTLNNREWDIQYNFLEYVHSNDTAITMQEDEWYGWRSRYVHNWERSRAHRNFTNQSTESWAETIIIRPPTGGDDTLANLILYVGTTAGAIAVIGVGIVLIRKFVVKV